MPRQKRRERRNLRGAVATEALLTPPQLRVVEKAISSGDVESIWQVAKILERIGVGPVDIEVLNDFHHFRPASDGRLNEIAAKLTSISETFRTKYPKRSKSFFDVAYRGALDSYARHLKDIANRDASSARLSYWISLLSLGILQSSGILKKVDDLHGLDAFKASETGRLLASEPPSQEVPVSPAPTQLARETILLLPPSEKRRRGRPPKNAKKSSRTKLKPFVLKLSIQELERLERMRRRSGASTAADAIRAALRTFETIVDALLRGQDVVLQDPKDSQKREYLKLG
jgi:hypothetical protein